MFELHRTPWDYRRPSTATKPILFPIVSLHFNNTSLHISNAHVRRCGDCVRCAKRRRSKLVARSTTQEGKNCWQIFVCNLLTLEADTNCTARNLDPRSTERNLTILDLLYPDRWWRSLTTILPYAWNYTDVQPFSLPKHFRCSPSAKRGTQNPGETPKPPMPSLLILMGIVKRDQLQSTCGSEYADLSNCGASTLTLDICRGNEPG